MHMKDEIDMIVHWPVKPDCFLQKVLRLGTVRIPLIRVYETTVIKEKVF